MDANMESEMTTTSTNLQQRPSQGASTRSSSAILKGTGALVVAFNAFRSAQPRWRKRAGAPGAGTPSRRPTDWIPGLPSAQRRNGDRLHQQSGPRHRRRNRPVADRRGRTGRALQAVSTWKWATPPRPSTRASPPAAAPSSAPARNCAKPPLPRARTVEAGLRAPGRAASKSSPSPMAWSASCGTRQEGFLRRPRRRQALQREDPRHRRWLGHESRAGSARQGSQGLQNRRNLGRRAWICRQSSPASSSTRRTCACRACCTAAWFVRRR